MGDAHVALGSDFDGAVTTPLDASQLPELTQALLQTGLSTDSVTKVLGVNLLTFLQKQLPNSD